MKVADITEGMRVRIYGAPGGQVGRQSYALGTVVRAPGLRANKKWGASVKLDKRDGVYDVAVSRLTKHDATV